MAFVLRVPIAMGDARKDGSVDVLYWGKSVHVLLQVDLKV